MLLWIMNLDFAGSDAGIVTVVDEWRVATMPPMRRISRTDEMIRITKTDEMIRVVEMETNRAGRRLRGSDA